MMDEDEVEEESSTALLLKDLQPANKTNTSQSHRDQGSTSNSHTAITINQDSDSSVGNSNYPPVVTSSRINDLDDPTLQSSISAYFVGDYSHPKRLTFMVQYIASVIFLIYALSIPFFVRHHLHSPTHPPHSGEGDSRLGRTWFSLLLLFQSVHQALLGYANSQSLQLQVHDVEYYEHNFAGVVAWFFGGLCHIARLNLIWDVMQAHGHEIGGGTIFLVLSGFFLIIVYFFYDAKRSSLSAHVAAITAALMSLFLSFALFHASSLNHVSPGSAIGAGVGLWLYALLVYPMMCLRTLQRHIWIMECINIICWTWLVLCYQAFDNCVL